MNKTRNVVYYFIVLLTILRSINSVEVDSNDNKINNSSEENINKNSRESKQLYGTHYYDGAENFPTSTSLLLDHNYDIENGNTNNYAYQGGVNTVGSGYNYYEQGNKNVIKITDIYDSRSTGFTENGTGNATDNQPENIDSSMISITTDKSTETTTKIAREAKDYSFPSSIGGSSDNAVSSTNSGSSNSYKYPYPYPGSTDTGSASGGYYYYHDDKNYWQTAPPAITSEKPMPGPTVLECHPSSPMPGVLSEIFRVTGLAKVSILKAVLTAVLVLLILKIPALLILKLIIFKVVLVPLGAISVLLPVILPMVYLWPNLATALGLATTTTTTTTTAATPQNQPAAAPAAAPANAPSTAAPATRTGKSVNQSHDQVVEDEHFESRALPLINSNKIQEIIGNLVNSERCLERIACKLGARDSRSTYRKHISWILKQLQGAVNDDARRHLRSYREAYNLGSSKQDICNKGHYPCEIPKLTLTQNSHTYRLI